MAALTLPSDTGEFHVYNGAGQRIMDTRGGTVYIWGSVSISENVDIDGTVNIGGTVDIGGTVSIHGSPSLLIDGSVTIDDVLTVHADATFDGSVEITGDLDVTGTTNLGGTLTLTADLDANGHEIHGGSFNTDSGIVISGATIDMGANTLSFDLTKISVNQSFSIASALTVGGSTQTDGLDNNGNGSVNGSGTTLGAFGSSGSTIQNVVVTGQTTDDKLDDLIAALAAYHLITTS